MDADGGNVRQLTDDPRSDINPAWSPDGTWIAFEGYSRVRSFRGDSSDIYVIDADGGNVRRLTGTRGHRDYLAGDYDPAWSPVP